MEHKQPKVLLLEDNVEDAIILRETITQDADSPFELEHATRLSVALEHLARGGIDLVVCDLHLEDSEGLETIEAVRRQAPEVPIVVLTASDDDELALQALQQGAQDYLVKGYVQVYPTLLRRAMRYALERKRSQDDLRSAKERTDKLLSSVPSILIEINADGVVTHWNPVAEAVFQVSAKHVLNQSLTSCPVMWETKKIVDGIVQCQSSNQLTRLEEVRFTRPNNAEEGYLGVTLVPMKGDAAGRFGVLLFGADITERKQAARERQRLQTQLVQAQRMETVGRFAGGIAHDFNNFLQIILGFTGLIRARHQKDQPLMSDLNEVIHAAESASGMVQQLLAFSRRRPSQPRRFEINQHIGNMARLIQQLIGEHIRLSLRLSTDPLIVELDPTALEQIIMNLSSNARDSMREGGTLTISTKTVTLDDAFTATHSWARPGEFVQMSVQDTGTGMEPDVAARIFEPFFTTKQLGRGTGLGLAVVYGLVTQYEGLIDIDSAPAKGTTFHIYLPRQTQPHTVAKDIDLGQPPESAEASLKDNGEVLPRVLIVDDDASIGLLCARMLDGLYETVTTASPINALEILEREPYDLLLSDIRMPDMDGFALAREALKRRPELKVLLMTGSLTMDVEAHLMKADVHCEVIRKPFTAAYLRKALLRSCEKS